MFLLLYPQYNHTHLFQKSYFEGGLTIDQFEHLLRIAVRHENNKFRMQAALQGVQLPEDNDDPQVKQQNKQRIKSGGMFGDPSEYADMTDEERAAADAKLMDMMRRIGLPIQNME